MLVKYWMSKPVITIDVEDNIKNADTLLKRHNIRGLPVMRNNRLVGYLTEKDVKRASTSEVMKLENVPEIKRMLDNIKVRSFMENRPVRIPLDYTIEKAAQVMLQNRIMSAPVVDSDGSLQGIISQTDIFRLLVSLTGVERAGIQFAFQLEDRPGSVKEVTDVIRGFGGRILSILISYHQVPEGFRKIYIRTFGVDRSQTESLKIQLSEKFSLLYVVEDYNDFYKLHENRYDE